MPGKTRLRNDLLCVERDVKPYTLTHSLNESGSKEKAVLCRMGVASMDYKQLSQQIELKTGAMDAGPHLAEHHTSSDLFEQVTN